MSLELCGPGKDTQKLCLCDLRRKQDTCHLPSRVIQWGLSSQPPLKIRFTEVSFIFKKYTHLGEAAVENRRELP